DGFPMGDFQEGAADNEHDLTVKLVADQPVEGRVVDLEGRPIAGAAVRGQYMFYPKKGDIGPWLRALPAQEGSPDQLRNEDLWHMPFNPIQRGEADYEGKKPPDATSDAQGRFALKGLGRDRLVYLKVEGPTIRPVEVQVITRPIEPIRVPMMAREPRF